MNSLASTHQRKKSSRIPAVRSISGGPSPSGTIDVVVLLVVDVVLVVVVDVVVVKVVVVVAATVVDVAVVEVVVAFEPEQAASSNPSAASSLRLRPLCGVYPFPIGEALCTTPPRNAKQAFALLNISYRSAGLPRPVLTPSLGKGGSESGGVAASDLGRVSLGHDRPTPFGSNTTYGEACPTEPVQPSPASEAAMPSAQASISSHSRKSPKLKRARPAGSTVRRR